MGPGDEEGLGKYWNLTISLPPELQFINGGSEEFIRYEADPSIYWDVYLQKSQGSRREQYRSYLEQRGGYENDKPISTCTITSSQEISIISQDTYLDVRVNCKSPNSDGTIYSYDTGAYLYSVQGMLLIINKSSKESQNQLLEPYLKDIFLFIKVSM